jgi:GNAT superfamily N-acetyltransferase
MRDTDVPAAESVTGLAFRPAKNSTRSPEAASAWEHKATHLLRTDPDGCWVADDGDAVIGVAMSTRRDLMWVLATYAVMPGHQGKGVGAALLDAAIGYGAGCLRGFICALPDPKALRRYRLAGFRPHPTMRLTGAVDRSAMPIIDGVRDGTDADHDLADSVDRRIRGAAHGPDHAELARDATLLVCDLFTGSGYAYVNDSSVKVLAATNRAVAQRLLWAALARMPAGAQATVRYLTSDQDWAIDVGLAAGLNIEPDGFLALRHMRPPSPYIPSPQFA